MRVQQSPPFLRPWRVATVTHAASRAKEAPLSAPVSNPASPTSFPPDPSRRAPPYDQAGSLTPDQVDAVTADLLPRHGLIGEQDVMDATTLPLVQLPHRDGFVPDPRPEVGKAAT
jgi:hypothetical protein